MSLGPKSGEPTPEHGLQFVIEDLRPHLVLADERYPLAQRIRGLYALGERGADVHAGAAVAQQLPRCTGWWVAIPGKGGTIGLQCVQIPKGDPGPSGAQGLQGDKGDKGDKGDPGVKGVDCKSTDGEIWCILHKN